MEDKIYDEYVLWLKNTLNLSPTDMYSGLNAIEEIKALRDECLGLHCETKLVKIMKSNNHYENRVKEWERFSVLTFEEYKASKK
jgi:hypothetical protein